MNRDEIVLERRTVVGEQVGRGSGGWSGARRIARVELGRAWPSYLIAAIVTPLVGLISLNALWLDLEANGSNLEGVPASVIADGFFLFALANLGINWTSLRWMYVHRDPFTAWLSFLRTLPISPRDVVLGRMAIMLAATTVMSLAFFLPAYALFPALRAAIPPSHLLWFAFFWIGYALFSGGLLLYLELGLKGGATLVVSLTWAALLVSVIAVAHVLGVPLVEESLELVEAYGPLVAIPALALGGIGLFSWCRLLERRLRTRELPS